MSVGSMRYYSESQQRQTILNFVLPNDIPEILTEGNPHYKRPTKNLYLLHGYSGDEYDWLLQGDIVNLSINYNLAIFTFSGGNNFYLDREATGRKYSRFVGDEIVKVTREMFHLSHAPKDTLIGGLSMGGFGAIQIGYKYSDVFGGIISLSPAMVIEEIAQMKKGENNFIANYDYFSEVFGQLDTLESSENNPVNVIQNLKTSNKHMPHLYVAMGTEDPILESLKPFIDFLNTNNIDHVYVEDRGVHDWEFWKRHIVLGVEDLLKNL